MQESEMHEEHEALPEVEALLEAMTEELELLFERRELDRERLIPVGIHTGGVWVAQALRKRLGLEEPLATLDIGFWRDDFGHKGLPDGGQGSQLPDIENRDLLLVDDVLMSGRTVRAALNELFDYGRPRRVLLACLVELPGRELPVQPDALGANLALAPGKRIKLEGPDNLRLTLVDTTEVTA